jgi:hypothetical protein
LAIAVLACSGCSAIFYVGETETETDGTSGDASSAESASPTSNPTSPSSSGDGTTSSTTTVGEVATLPETTEPTSATTTSESETTPITTEGSTASAEGQQTTGPTGCAELEYAMCIEEPGCLWEGTMDVGDCFEDPCFETDCDGLGADDCQMADMCILFPELEGTCYHNECFPCTETVAEEVCMAALNCMWFEGVCSPAD